MKTCKTCKFFNPRRYLDAGGCQYDPPVLKITDNLVQAWFPPVMNDDWCGKHEDRSTIE